MTKNIIIIRNAYNHDFGGGERFPVFLAESLISYGYNPLVVSRNNKLIDYAKGHGVPTIKGWWWNKQSWTGWQVALFPVYLLWQSLLFAWYLWLFIKHKPTAVHIQSKDDFISATFAGKLLGITTVWTDHADLKHVWLNLSNKLKNPVGKLVYLSAFLVDYITVVSESERQAILSHLDDGSKITKKIQVVYNGCEDKLSNYRDQTSNNLFTFCTANRLVSDKGIGEAIEAFKLFNNKYPNCELLLIGDGPESEKFKNLAHELDNIKFVGHKDDPYSLIAQSDVFLQPTYHEGFSVVLVEASMLQKPIIATNVGGNIEIILESKTGLLVPPRDSAGLAEAMKRLYNDKDLRQNIAMGARQQYLDRFVFNTIVKERFLPLYEIKN